MSDKCLPSREVVERVIQEEAKSAGVLAADIIHCRKSPTAIDARRRAIWRIVHETGCSASGLGTLWGLDTVTVTDALKRVHEVRAPRRRSKAQQAGYDAATVARLNWQYGPRRTARIVAGEDDATNLDLARWKLLCAKAAA